MAKQKKEQYVLTAAVWKGADKLPAGTVVEFDGEPTGVYRGRCRPAGALTVATPDSAELAATKAALAKAEKERDEAVAALAAAKQPPAPPGSA